MYNFSSQTFCKCLKILSWNKKLNAGFEDYIIKKSCFIERAYGVIRGSNGELYSPEDIIEKKKGLEGDDIWFSFCAK